MRTSLGAKTLAYVTPVWVIGTYDKDGKANAMTASWAGICCSKPPCVCVSLRKATYTYNSLLARKAFTVSIPSERYLKEADYFGMASGREVDKFAVTGLTAERSIVVDAPYVAEFPVVLECNLIHTYEIGLHTQFIGEIVDIKADSEVMGPNGMPDAALVQPFSYIPGTEGYYALGKYLGQAWELGTGFKA